MIHPRISVILPTYNRAHVLPRAVQSVLDQSFHDFELIIVDDGSHDHTEQLIKNTEDRRIRYYQHKENRGAAAARNTGISISRGDFIAFQDSDNVWLPDKLQKQVNVLASADLIQGIVYTDAVRMKGSVGSVVPQPFARQKEGDLRDQLLFFNSVDLPAALVRKECFAEYGPFDEALPCLQDWELWIRLSESYRFLHIPEALTIGYYEQDSISLDRQKAITATEHIMAKHRDKYLRNRKAFSRVRTRLGKSHCVHADIRKGRAYFIEAFRRYPVSVQNLVYWAVSSLGRKVSRTFFRGI